MTRYHPPGAGAAALTVSPLLVAARVGMDPARLYAANADAAACYAALLPDHQPAIDYLRRRGVADAAAPGSAWQLGYAPPGWRTLVDHLRERGFRDDELYAAGVAVHGRHGQLRDRFRDRLVFPVHDQYGQVVGFTARDLSGRADVPKYLNTPETVIYHKGRLLYGLGVHLAHPPAGGRMPLAIVVEGAADALATWRMGKSIAALPDAVPIYPVAPCGTALTADQLQLLRDTLPAGTSLAIAFDGDPAGRRAFTRAYPLLRTWPGTAYAITLPAGRDPADLLATQGPAGGLAILARRMAPAARTALTATLDRLHADGAITDPRVYPADRHRAIAAIADYFIDHPADTPALARAAARRLGIRDTDVVRAVIDRTFPTDPDPPDTWAKAPRAGGAATSPTPRPHTPTQQRGELGAQCDARFRARFTEILILVLRTRGS
jgi:DNA primase catalytic core